MSLIVLRPLCRLKLDAFDVAIVRYVKRVSGGWFVRVGRIPAWAATATCAFFFICAFKCVLPWAPTGFLCCIPIKMEFVSAIVSFLSALLTRCWVNLEVALVIHA